MSRATAKSDAVLTEQGIKALNKALGVANTHRFLTLARPSPTDYVKISRKLFAGQTVEEIFTRSKARLRAR